MANLKNTNLDALRDDYKVSKKETRLSKTPDSKNISVSDWNMSVAYLETLLNDVNRIYTDMLPEIDDNLLSNSVNVRDVVRRHLLAYVTAELSFSESLGSFSLNLYDNSNGKTKICSGYVDSALEEAIKALEVVYRESTKVYAVKLTNVKGTVSYVDLPELFNKSIEDALSNIKTDITTLKQNVATLNTNKLSKSTTPETVYGVGPTGAQVQFPIVKGDDSISDWNTQLASKQYVWLRNSSRGDQVYPTDIQIKSGTAVGWYRIAERSSTNDGTGGCTSIFKVLCYGTGKGESTLIFSVSMAEHNVIPAISILSNSYRLGSGLDTPPITKIRVSREAAKTGKAYVEVYLNVSPTLTSGKVCVRFRTETLLYDSARRWVLMAPAFTTESYNVTEKYAVDYSWSDVTLPTSYLNEIPNKITELENSVVSEYGWISLNITGTTIDEVQQSLHTLTSNSKQIRFESTWRYDDIANSYDGDWNEGADIGTWIHNNIYFTQILHSDGTVTLEGVRGVEDTNNPNGYVIEHIGFGDDFSDKGLGSYTLQPWDPEPEFSYTVISFSTNLKIKIKNYGTISTQIGCTTIFDPYAYSYYPELGDWRLVQSVEAYVKKNNETEKYFPSTFSLRDKSTLNMLKLKAEENLTAYLNKLKEER